MVRTTSRKISNERCSNDQIKFSLIGVKTGN